MENNRIEEQAANAILDRGVKYSNFKSPPKSFWDKLKRLFSRNNSITIKPLKFGVTLSICRELAVNNLTKQAVKEGEADLPGFMAKFGDVVIRCIAMATLNHRRKINNHRLVQQQANWYSGNLTNYQVYELFVFVVTLSGMEDFMSTTRLLWTMKGTNLGPRRKGSYKDLIAPLD